jgi:hypothetical protein
MFFPPLSIYLLLRDNEYRRAIAFIRRCSMRSIALAAVLTGSILMSHGGNLSAAIPTVACELITQARVSAALGVTVGAGTPIARPGACQWFGKGRFATLTLTQPLAGKTPLEQFNAGKTSKRIGITVEPVSVLRLLRHHLADGPRRHRRQEGRLHVRGPRLRLSSGGG